MKKLLLVFLLLLMCGCSGEKTFDEIIKENNYIIVDVRTKEEYSQGHVVDAINIPYDELDSSLDKNKTIIVYCQSGKRSKVAYDLLVNMGYDVYDLGSYNTITLEKTS